MKGDLPFSLFILIYYSNMSKRVQVLADLTLENSRGTIRINNNKEGDLIVNFPDEDTFFNLQKINLPYISGWNSLLRINRAFRRNRQSVKINVKGSTWMTLGKSSRPQFNYGKVVTRYVSRTPSIKNTLYAAIAALTASFLYLFLKRRS